VREFCLICWSFLFLLLRRRGRSTSNQTGSGVEEIDGAVPIGDEETLETETLKQFRLEFGTGVGNSGDGIGADGLDGALELLRLYPGQLLRLREFQLGQRPLVFDIGRLHGDESRQFCVGFDLGGGGLEVRLRDGGLALDGGGLRSGGGLGGGLTRRLNGGRVSLQFQQRRSGFLRFGLVFDLLSLQFTPGLLFQSESVVTRGRLLRFGGDFNGELYRFL